MCHRFGGDGQSTGPDLTQLAGRFSVNALAESIVEPSKVIADHYRSHSIVADGKTYTGRIVAEIDGKVTMITDPEDATKTVEIPRSEIESESISPISLMPDRPLEAAQRQRSARPVRLPAVARQSARPNVRCPPGCRESADCCRKIMKSAQNDRVVKRNRGLARTRIIPIIRISYDYVSYRAILVTRVHSLRLKSSL